VGADYIYKDEAFDKVDTWNWPRGQIVEFTTKDKFCHSYLLPAGASILHPGTLAVIYLLILLYLFIGIQVVADIFMDSITVITSSKRTIQVRDENDEMIPKKVPVWNPTVANLTLMALGSSAPEILLSVIETISTLDSTPGELGPSTIVGSAAFNFLVISGVSIYSVSAANDERTDEEIAEDGTPKGVKKVADTGVFTITTVWSVFAYAWLYYCLSDEEGEVTPLEAWLTFGFFWILLIMAFIADKINQRALKKRNDLKFGDEYKDTSMGVQGAGVQYNVVDFYNTLLPQEIGQADALTKEQEAKSNEMKTFLKKQFGTDKIQLVNKDILKQKLEGDSLIERIGYRKQVGDLLQGRKEIVKHGEIYRKEHLMAHQLDVSKKNNLYGFTCLHYSVSESSGHLRIKMSNKTATAGRVGVRTVDAEATSPKDFEAIDEIIEFKAGQKIAEVRIKIVDDDNWEPDEDFYVELYDIDSRAKLDGEDCKTRVTIIDDDRPGILAFENKGNTKHPANETTCNIKVIRLHDNDGEINVKYRTIEISKSTRTATPGKDYEHVEGILNFIHRESEKEIVIPIIQRETENDEPRDEIFGVQIYDAHPAAVKISKKDTCIVEIVTDAETKKQAEALQQLLARINQQEKITWGQQFKNACMLHPSKNEDGEIEDISGFDAVFHFLSIGWKVLFAAVPPPHYLGGIPCFLVALAFIGFVTAIVGEIATLMGCVIFLKPGVTAITFVAIGTSLPDTFASKKAAQDSRYADSAVGNVTGSNSVNVFLGLGLPWVIASLYYGRKDEKFNVPSKGLDLSVALFLIVSLIGIVILIVRRIVVKGELGGSPAGRTASAIVFVSLWLFYVIMSTLAQYEVISFGMEK